MLVPFFWIVAAGFKTQISLLHVDASNAHHHAKEMGEQVAAIASGSIATLIASIVFLVYFI